MSGSERGQFAEALHDLLGDAGVPAAARRWADGDLAPGLALWRRLAGLGVTALAVPEKWGGLGASPLDLVVACEELGHHAVPGPVAESLAAVPTLLAAREDAGARGEWLPALAAGNLIATLAMPPQLPFAADAGAAGLVLLAKDDTVYRARLGATHRSVDPARSLSEAHGGEVLARHATAAMAAALDFGALACSAQLLDAAAVALADDTGLAGTGLAGTGLAGTGLAGTGTAAGDVSAAKVACADAAYRAARAALQVHGAIGYTAEHDLSLWLAKVRALVPAWGSQAEHRARVVAGLT